LKRAIVCLIAIALWASPIHATSAQTKTASLPEAIQVTTTSNESVQEPIQINSILVDDGRGEASIPDARGSTNISGPTSGRYNGKIYSKEEVQAFIVQYSQEYGIPADLPLRIAYCESGFNQMAANKGSSARGVYQWLASSWKNQPASQGGVVSVFDARANVSAAVWLIAHNQTSPWNASRSCWSKQLTSP